ncbi:MAG: PAS domain S-box protein [Nitrospirae bacterium]|nr:PAS domain S-box protein [Nitrospirota bacterium]
MTNESNLENNSTTIQLNHQLISWYKTTSEITSVLVFLTGLSVLTGWIFDIQTFKSIYPGMVSMKANTALAFVLIGITLWLLQTKRINRLTTLIAKTCALTVIIIGALTLFEYLLNVELNIDQLLFKDELLAVMTSHPGRMSPNTAINFVLIGAALFLVDAEMSRGLRPAQLLMLIEGLISFVSVAGYIYSLSIFYSISYYTAMSFHSSLSFILVFIGILFARPDKGIMAIFVSNSIGGMIVRRLLPLVIAVPMLTDILFNLGIYAGFYDSTFASAVHEIILTVLLIGMILSISKLLNKAESNRMKAEEATKSVARFPDENPYPVLRISKDYKLLYANRSSQPMVPLLCDVDKECTLSPMNDWYGAITETLNSGIRRVVEISVGKEYFYFTICPILDMGYVNVYGYNITKLKKVEGSLRISENNYKALMEHASDGITIADTEGNYIDVNTKACQMLGYLKEDFLRLNIRDVVHPEDLSKIPLRLSELRDGLTILAERRLLRKDGSFIYSEISAKMLPDGRFQAIIRDITQRRKDEERLRLFSQAIEEAMDGVNIVDLQGNILYVNKAFQDVTGYSPQESLGMPVCSFDADQDIAQKVIMPAIMETGRWCGELMAKHKNGRVYPIWLSASQVKNEAEQPIAMLGVFRDLTSVKEIQEAQQSSEETLRALMDAITESVFLMDVNGTVLTINTTGARRVGKLPNDIIGKNIYDFIPSDVSERRKQFVSACITNKTPINYEDIRNERNYIHNVYPVFGVDGNVNKLAIFTIDITERKKAIDDLKESEEKFKSLADKSPNMIYIHKKGRFVYVNDNCLDTMQYTKEELFSPDFHFLKFISPDVIDTLMVGYTRRLEGENTAPFETTLITKQGKTIDAIITTKIITYEGEQAIMGIVTDITEYKKSENALQRSLKEKELLLKEIHHRVKNNLQVISSLIGLQVEYMGNTACKDMLMESQNRIRSIALVHDKLYRTDGLAEIDLKGYVMNLANDLFLSFGCDTSKIILLLDIDSIYIGIDIAIPCGLIINELFSNILKHAFPDKRGGEIKISIHLLDKDKIELRLSDNGIGIPENIDIKKSESLGLHIVYTLVRQLRGTIELNIERGTKIIIKFRKSNVY